MKPAKVFTEAERTKALATWGRVRHLTNLDPSRPKHLHKDALLGDIIYRLKSGLAPEGHFFWWVEVDEYVVEQWLDGYPTLPQFSPVRRIEA